MNRYELTYIIDTGLEENCSQGADRKDSPQLIAAEWR